MQWVAQDMSDVGEATAESLACEGDAFLLQNITMRRIQETTLWRQINLANQRLAVLKLELEKLERAMRLKHRDGANLIYERTLVRIPTLRDAPHGSIQFETFEKVP